MCLTINIQYSLQIRTRKFQFSKGICTTTAIDIKFLIEYNAELI